MQLAVYEWMGRVIDALTYPEVGRLAIRSSFLVPSRSHRLGGVGDATLLTLRGPMHANANLRPPLDRSEGEIDGVCGRVRACLVIATPIVEGMPPHAVAGFDAVRTCARRASVFPRDLACSIIP